MESLIPKVTFVNCIRLKEAMECYYKVKNDDYDIYKTATSSLILIEGENKYKIKLTKGNNFIVEWLEKIKE